MPNVNHRARISGKGIVDESILQIDIGPNAIGNSEMADNAVGFTELTTGLQGSLGGMPNSIGTTELKDPSVDTSELYDDAVGSQHIDDDAIGSSAMIGDDVIITDHIVAGAVVSESIEDDAIGSEHLDDNAISYAAQIKDGIIGSEEIADGAISLNKLLYVPDMGTIANVTAGGVYRQYSWGMLGEGALEYSIAPAVVLTAEGNIPALLDHAPGVGSFKAKLEAAGTADVHYLAMGYVAR